MYVSVCIYVLYECCIFEKITECMYVCTYVSAIFKTMFCMDLCLAFQELNALAQPSRALGLLGGEVVAFCFEERVHGRSDLSMYVCMYVCIYMN